MSITSKLVHAPFSTKSSIWGFSKENKLFILNYVWEIADDIPISSWSSSWLKIEGEVSGYDDETPSSSKLEFVFYRTALIYLISKINL